VVGKQWNTQILVYLPVTYVPGGTSSTSSMMLGQVASFIQISVGQPDLPLVSWLIW
jgi:hypothetical protein